jgi:lysophospholipase L1-like esterase
LPTLYGIVIVSLAVLASGPVQHATSQPGDHWVASWGAAQQIPEPRNALPAALAGNVTIRQIVHLSLGGARLRVRLSNRFGIEPLVIGAAHIARAAKPGTSAIVSGSDVALTFGGQAEITIPAGAAYFSDPVALDAPDGGDLAISLYLPEAAAPQTGHPGSRSTSFALAGNHAGDATLPGAMPIEHWYQLSDVEVAAPADGRAIVAIGDSITDGHATTVDGNTRWTDVLAARLRADPVTRGVAVVNTGIGGNRVLLDGLGPNLMARFGRDALDRSGVVSIIVLEGVNDLGMQTREHPVSNDALAAQRGRIIDGFRRMIERAHARGLRIYGGTITPFVGSDYYHPGAAVDADRRAINDWIRAPGHFDGVVDFDRAIRDPAHPERLLPAYDSGDHLHPSNAGYAAMAKAVPLMVAQAPKTGSAVGPAVAITFDDLPAHGPLPKGDTRVAIMARISAALRAAGAPPTYGFTNGGFAANEPASRPALAAWRRAGNLLANHSWSHMNADQNNAAAWEADVLRDEPVIAPLMRGADWHWLRFPYLAEGDTPAKRAAIRRFLGAHGYKIASVTMSFSDYLWNEPYARCVATGDAGAIAELKRSYLQAATDTLDYTEAVSQKLYGRDIPLVLLMHVGALDSIMLPDLLRLYQRRGVRFVSLADAESDPFYKGEIDPPAGATPATLEAVAAARGTLLPPAPAAPSDLATLCQ